MVNMVGKVDNNSDWVVDFGAIKHITCNQELLENITRNTLETTVTIPNGDWMPGQGKGSCILQDGIKIDKVLHILSFDCNLLSVSRLTKDLQCAITFLPGLCYMQDLLSRNLIGASECRQGLYWMGMVAGQRRVLMTTEEMDLWHKRLGHAFESKLNQVDF